MTKRMNKTSTNAYLPACGKPKKQWSTGLQQLIVPGIYYTTFQ